MSGQFKIDIVNPEKSFLTSEEAIEVIIPAYEGEMGILSDHISTISFLSAKNAFGLLNFSFFFWRTCK